MKRKDYQPALAVIKSKDYRPALAVMKRKDYRPALGCDEVQRLSTSPWL
ncbi:hypothetical protein [Paenibacillus odorifer]|nr:hypothetical protein [Paenibacillus odorifer]